MKKKNSKHQHNGY